MSTQSEDDLVLVGNITVDDVYQIQGWPLGGTSNTYSSNRKSVGGLGNIVDALDGRLLVTVNAMIGNDNDGEFVKYYLRNKGIGFDEVLEPWGPKTTTKALIFSDTKNNERTSFVEWGCGKLPYTPKWRKAKWAHMSYIDILPDINMRALRESCGTLSTDVCLSTPPPGGLPKLKDFDYLFISEVEAKAYGESIYDLGPTVVCHTREDTTITWKNGSEKVKGRHKTVENIDVLGAGDAYVAGFILNMLKGESLAGSAQEAHEEATRFLLNRRGS